MRQFFKFFFASMLGFIVGSLLLTFLFIAILAGIVASASDDKESVVKNNSVLLLSLDYMIPERTSKNPFEDFDPVSMEGSRNTGLADIIRSIRAAADDDNIKGIYLDLTYSPNSYATLEDIRNELIGFKKSGKFVIAYGEIMEEHSYYLASVADKIYLNPAGELVINGFSYSQAYLKGMFDKLGVEPQLIRHGKYKAAGEPLIADKMSAENREQIEAFAGSMYRHFIAGIASARKKSVEEVRNISDKLLIQDPESAVQHGLIDSLLYEDEVMEGLRNRLGLEAKEKISFIEPSSYGKKAKDERVSATSKNKIAVVYVDGDIVSGESGDGSAGSETICESLDKMRKDSAVKAIVIRVNSPGGSALASDVMWREVELAKKSKPVIVSFGSVAASGGYYLATPADVIVAQPNTITGSIGVFALLVNAQKLLKEKLGINMQKVNFGEYADLGAADRPMTEGERQVLQRMVDRIYNDFVSKVSEGRGLTREQVDSLAQGRVWTGEDAKKLGLVDELGGLDKAISIAVERAGLEDYRITTLPELDDPFSNLLKTFGSDASIWFTKKQLGENYIYYEQLRKASTLQGIQARMVESFEF
jgi:protease-4